MNRHTHPDRRARLTGAALWLPGLAVAVGAAVATAHGLYEVAAGAGAPAPIAWLYPLITDGLALVAYAATTRLDHRGRRYAWTVVVVAAGLSGLAQAGKASGWVGDASPALRFGVGAWPAIAAAIVAHLLFMLGSHTHTDRDTEAPPRGKPAEQPATPVQPTRVHPAPVQPQPVQPATVQPAGVQRPGPGERSTAESGVQPGRVPALPAGMSNGQRPVSGGSPAKELARAAARRHVDEHGRLPTVSELVALAEVSRGTAGTALKELREQHPALHLVRDQNPLSRTQP